MVVVALNRARKISDCGVLRPAKDTMLLLCHVHTYTPAQGRESHRRPQCCPCSPPPRTGLRTRSKPCELSARPVTCETSLVQLHLGEERSGHFLSQPAMLGLGRAWWHKNQLEHGTKCVFTTLVLRTTPASNCFKGGYS